MKTVHHLDDATLMRFASGDLDEAFSIAVSAHLELCGECRSGLRAAEACGGQLLEMEHAVATQDGAFDRLRDHLQKTEIKLTETDRDPSHINASEGAEIDTVPKSLRRYIGASFDTVPWKTVAPGVRKFDVPLQSSSRQKLYMLHIAEGKEVPEHGHDGAEMTVVLSGAYRDEHGRFGRGDVADLDEHDEHQPKVEMGGPCICLVAAEGYTRPKSLLARLLQPLVRI